MDQMDLEATRKLNGGFLPVTLARVDLTDFKPLNLIASRVNEKSQLHFVALLKRFRFMQGPSIFGLSIEQQSKIDGTFTTNFISSVSDGWMQQLEDIRGCKN